jgi:hypothetical protein
MALYFNENDAGAKVVVLVVLVDVDVVEVLVDVDVVDVDVVEVLVVVVVPIHTVSPSNIPVPTDGQSPRPKLVTIQFGATSIELAHIFSVVPVNTVTIRGISSHPKYSTFTSYEPVFCRLYSKQLDDTYQYFVPSE